jgi:hypothetical protein
MRPRLLAPLATATAAAVAAIFSVAAIAGTIVSPTADPGSHPDARAPRLRVYPIEFVVGSSIDATIPYDPEECDFRFWHFDVPMRLSWLGNAGEDGVDHYDVWQVPSFTEPSLLLHDTLVTSLDVKGGDYDGSCGGPPVDVAHRIVAFDVSGNEAAVTGDTNLKMGTWQEDGSTILSLPPGTVSTTRDGTWTVDDCSCSDAGHTLYSTTAGDSATFFVTPEWGGQSVALVMPMDTDRGEVTIAVDGGEPMLVDTFAETAQDRTIVWQTKLADGDHTVVITNQGTPGRSRVDLDAVLLS